MSLKEAPCTLATPHESTFVALLTLQPTSMQNGNICWNISHKTKSILSDRATSAGVLCI